MKKIIAIILLLTFLVSYSQKDVKQEINQIKTQIENINNINTNQQQKIIELEEIKLIKSNYQHKVEKIETSMQKAQEREDSFLTYIQWFFTILGAAVLFFTGGSLYEMRQAKKNVEKNFNTQIKEYTDKKNIDFENQINNQNQLFEEQLAQFTARNEKQIKFMIDEKTWEFELMSKSNIMVVNPNQNGDTKKLKPVLKWFENKGGNINNINKDFSAPAEIVDEAKNQINKSNKEYNILLLENSDGNWNLNQEEHKENAQAIAKNLPKKTMLVYFGPRDSGNYPSNTNDYYAFLNDEAKIIIKKYSKGGRLNIDDDDDLKKFNNLKTEMEEEVYNIIDKISFVNTPSKLYPNLIDALKYLDIIHNHKKVTNKPLAH